MSKADLYKLSDPHQERIPRRFQGVAIDRELAKRSPKDHEVQKDPGRKDKKK